MRCKSREPFIDDDGYVEWNSIMPLTLPKDVTFVNSENKEHAIKKFNVVFERIANGFAEPGKILQNDQLFNIQNLLERLCLKDANISLELFRNETVMYFLDRMKQAMIQNEIFLTFILNVDVYRSYPEYEKYVKDFVTYCFVLDTLTKNLMDSESLFQEVLRAIDNERENKSPTCDWREFATPFQRAKIATILPFIPDLSPQKVQEAFDGKETVDDTYNPLSRIGLSLNIIEAVLEDIRQENVLNAKAGYELAMLDGLLDFSKYSNEKRVLVARTSSMFRYSAFPRNWSDLYNAWNLVFVGNFKEFPYYAAKLLFPEVANYENRPHRYLYPRLLGLWLHIHYVLYEATHGNPRPEDLTLSLETRKRLGTITLTYAKAYRNFYDTMNIKYSPLYWIPIDYTTDKYMRFLFWLLKEGMISIKTFQKRLQKR